MPFEIDESSLTSILAEVERDLKPVLVEAKDRLLKAEDEKSGPPAKKDDEKSAPAEESSSSEGSAPPAEASAGGDAGGPPAPEASASAPADASAGGPPPPGPEASASPGGLPTDPAQLQQMIQSAPPEVQKAIYLAAKQALFASMGGAGAGPGPEASASPAPPMPPPGPEASASAPMPPPPGPEASAPPAGPPPPMMGKGEIKASPGNGGKSAPVKKSEPQMNTDVEDLKALVKAQAEDIKLLTKAVQHMAGTPVRKAVTGISVIAKSEAKEPTRLSKSEVNAKLSEKIREGDLTKKDRESIRRFYDTGSTNYTLVEHLLA
jgi:hypothetical protein